MSKTVIGKLKDELYTISHTYIRKRDSKDKDLYRDWETDRKSTRLNSSHSAKSRMPSSA